MLDTRLATAGLVLLVVAAEGDGRQAATAPLPPRPFPIAFAPAAADTFAARGPAGTVSVGAAGATLVRPGELPLETRFRGSDRKARGAALQRLPGTVSSFRGRDRARWRAGIPTFAAVRYADVYPGIAVTWHGRSGRLEYDFEVAPFADPSRIRLEFEGAARVALDATGAIVLRTGTGEGTEEVRHLRPVAYQEIGANRHSIPAEWRLAGGEARFALGSYDRTRPLVIDPVIVGSVVLGGTGFDSANAVSLDAAGNVYVTGESASLDFPLVGPGGRTPAGQNDVFVAKLDPTATTLLYSTVIGGDAADSGTGISIDASGSAWVTGETVSGDFPTAAGAFQADLAGATDAFAVKLDPSGAALVVSTLLGGEGFDRGNAIAVDAAGGAAIAGRTGSLSLPATKDALQTFFRGSDFDAFLARFEATGALRHLTYLGGSENDAAFGVAVDSADRAFVAGGTRSPDFPATAAAFQGSNFSTDAFLSAFGPGGALLYSTFLGGSFVDRANAVAVDARGRVLVVGQASSPDFPSVSPTQVTYGGGPNDAFVAAFDTAASGDASLVFSTFLGGRGDDRAHGIAVRAEAAVWVAGQASGTDFPVIDPSPIPPGGGASDAFAARFDLSAAPVLRFSTPLGGPGDDRAHAVAATASGDAVLAGRTDSTGFPPNASRSGPGGATDAFVLRVAEGGAPIAASVPTLSSAALGFLAAALALAGLALARRA